MGEIVAISCSSCGWSDSVFLGSGMPGHVLNESWEKHFPEGLANKYKRAIALVALKMATQILQLFCGIKQGQREEFQ